MSGPHRPVVAPRERGAALVVALVLVLASTLLGVSLMNMSTVETRLLANEGFRQSVFRAAEAVADRAIASVDVTALPEGSTGWTDTDGVEPSVDASVVVQTPRARLEGIEALLNSSIGLFESRLYAVSATAVLPAVNARGTVIQGASRRAPALRR